MVALEMNETDLRLQNCKWRPAFGFAVFKVELEKTKVNERLGTHFAVAFCGICIESEIIIVQLTINFPYFKISNFSRPVNARVMYFSHNLFIIFFQAEKNHQFPEMQLFTFSPNVFTPSYSHCALYCTLLYFHYTVMYSMTYARSIALSYDNYNAFPL